MHFVFEQLLNRKDITESCGNMSKTFLQRMLESNLQSNRFQNKGAVEMHV